jgi:uncharacterized protein (DUF1697 family)
VNTYVSLLRGINLASSRRVAMADLRTWLGELGYSDVRTHLQSGNAVFASPDSAAEVGRQIEKRLAERLGFPVDCVVRTPTQLRQVIAANPFEGVATDGARFQVAFLAAPLDPARLADVDPATFAPELFHLGQHEIYLWYPNGIQKSKLNGLLTNKRLGVSATARNWNTVTRLLELAGG